MRFSARTTVREFDVIDATVLVPEGDVAYPGECGGDIRPTGAQVTISHEHGAAVDVTFIGPRQLNGSDARDTGRSYFDLTDPDVTLPSAYAELIDQAVKGW